MIRLQVLISTYGNAGLDRLAMMDLPRVDEVEYLVSCQLPDVSCDIPSALERSDLKIYFSGTKGLSKNRNILLRLASAELCLIADDDLCFIREGLEAIIRTFDADPTLDIASFRYTDEYGKTEKFYPETGCDLRHPAKGFYISSVELAFRSERIRKYGIFFNENFGVGAPAYACGEEELWLHDLLNAGLNGRYFPTTIVIHHGLTTGLRRVSDPAVLRAQGVVITKLYPFTVLLRVILKAWRSSKASKTRFLFCLKFLLQGWIHGILFRRRLFNKQ